MVRRRLGATTFGCLFGALLLIAVLYFGAKIGQVFLDAYQYEDAMKQNARFAETLTDRQIYDRVVAKADSLGLPEEAKDVSVEREGRHLVISADYTVLVDLPLQDRSFHFSPHVEHDY